MKLRGLGGGEEEPGSECLLWAQSARSNPSVCKHGAESCRTEEMMWAAVLVLLSVCSSAPREEEGGRKRGREGGREGGWWETNKLSIQLLVASNTHDARSDH